MLLSRSVGTPVTAHRTAPGKCRQRGCLLRLHIASPDKVASTPAAAPVTSWQQLPTDLRNATAVLEAPNPAAPGGVTRVFVLGVSHVSQVSCDQIKQLVRAVRPEVVMVELCKDRIGLLVDPVNPDRRLETWHCRKVSLDGVPADDPLWPQEGQLLELIASRIGAAVSTQEIELDCARLLATGLFGKARPAAMTAGRGEAPLFGAVKPDTGDDEQQQAEAAADAGVGVVGYSGDVALQLVPPLGSLKFLVEPRKLPLVSSIEIRLDSSMKDAGVEPAQLQGIASGLLDNAAAEAKAKAAAAAAASPAGDGKTEGDKDKEGEEKEAEKDEAADADSSLKLYLQLRAQLAAAFPAPGQVVVAFGGVESGRVEVLVRARRAADPAYVSGLEASAEGGEGLGIDSFKPQRTSVQLSPGMLLPAEAAERLAAARAARQAERVLPPPAGWERRTQFRLWSQDEVSTADAQLPANPVADTFARLMTGLYSRLQAAAGDAAGITSGAAWRAALEAACEVGSQQVLLGDRPSDVTQRRLAVGISAASGGRLAASLGLLLAGVVSAATHALPDVEAAAAALTGAAAAGDAGIVLGSAAAALALAWPVLAPFAEVWQFSRLSGEEVEAAVAIKEPLQERLDQRFFVWGEDALLKWPGAVTPLIEERDAFMARVVAAAAQGSNPNVPAYVADQDNGQLIWRYMVPEGATASSAPSGAGDGPYVPLAGPAAVVSVVGSAHVRGMVQMWQDSLAAAGQLDDLLKAE
ncbi:hypothetical protein COO60DRAFT_1703286 [Scenedesmus sp. NREL 46B-D3]|nr:hypothetical protein COO60DRAFT_1703286 [Scenedesmus sp. NREL 46B-D3]